MKNERLRKMVLLAIFAAIILVMAFTPLGYLKIGALSLTLIPIPVAIGAVVLGPLGGALLGGVFGATSFAQCFGMDAFGTLLMGLNPWLTALLCLGSRILAGWLAGLISQGLAKQDTARSWSLFVTGFCTAAFNTILFMSGLYFFFAGNPVFQEQFGTHNIITLFMAMAGVNGLVEILACTLVTPPIAKALLHVKSRM